MDAAAVELIQRITEARYSMDRLAVSEQHDVLLHAAREGLSAMSAPLINAMATKMFGTNDPALIDVLQSAGMKTSFSRLTARDIKEVLGKGYAPAELKLAFDKAHALVSAKNADDQPIHAPTEMLLGILESGNEIPFSGQPVVTGFVDDDGLRTPIIEWSTDAEASDDPFQFSVAMEHPTEQQFASPEQMSRALTFLRDSVPHSNVNDGCDDRCTYTAALLEKVMGYKINKVKIRTNDDSLFEQDPPFPQPGGSRAEDASWKMHTAPIVYMDGEPFVLDVSMPSPIPLKEWVAKLTSGKDQGNVTITTTADGGWDVDLNDVDGGPLQLGETTQSLKGMNLLKVVDNDDFTVKTEGGVQWVRDGLFAAGMQVIAAGPQTQVPVITGFNVSRLPQLELREPADIASLGPHRTITTTNPLFILDAAFDTISEKMRGRYFSTAADAPTHTPKPRLINVVKGLVPSWS
jgi:hypothetical protein